MSKMIVTISSIPKKPAVSVFFERWDEELDAAQLKR